MVSFETGGSALQLANILLSSDHASATDAGFPSAYVFESPDAYESPYIHTTADTISTVDFTHMLDHARAGLGFVYELAFTSFDAYVM